MKVRIGVEIELTGVTRENVAISLSNLFHSKLDSKYITPSGSSRYKRYKTNGWLVLRDRSIRTEKYESNADSMFNISEVDDENYKVEVVSPVLTENSLNELFSVLSVLKALGGITNDTTGIHIHIDAPKSVLGILQKFVLQQDEILSSFGTYKARTEHYAKLFPESVKQYILTELNEQDNNSLLLKLKDELHENELRDVRYYALNIYSALQRNTVEFRFFNSTLEKHKVAKFLDWVLHFAYDIEDYSDYLPLLSPYLL